MQRFYLARSEAKLIEVGFVPIVFEAGMDRRVGKMTDNVLFNKSTGTLGLLVHRFHTVHVPWYTANKKFDKEELAGVI